MLSTKTWPRVIVPVSDPSTYVVVCHSDDPSIGMLTASQILKVVEVEKQADIRRPYIKQLITKNLKFPLPNRAPPKRGKAVFAANRPSTFF